jgi:hypothetical protein
MRRPVLGPEEEEEEEEGEGAEGTVMEGRW